MSRIIIGSDHAGFKLKEILKPYLLKSGFKVNDIGTYSVQRCDYPKIAYSLARQISLGKFSRGILICNTGIGNSIVANRLPGVRAALCYNIKAARLSRQHNDSNILVLGAAFMNGSEAKRITGLWLKTGFIGGRHKRRLNQIKDIAKMKYLKQIDPQVYQAVKNEIKRQEEYLELIASENFAPLAVLETQGSVLTNKYAEGYPQRRWYGGCEFVDQAEGLAIKRAKELFGAEYVNVQPHSGTQANMAVFFSALKFGETILAMDLSCGGHLTHGHPHNFSGMFYKVVTYGVDRQTERINYDEIERLALKFKPKLIIAGASAYPREIDFKKFRASCDKVGAYLLVDMAHIAGLVAAGVHPSPVPYADFVSSTTHKTLRGPRGGFIMAKKKFAKNLDSLIFPGTQGGPLMHVIAAKAVAFALAGTGEFRLYQEQVVRNARRLSSQLNAKGFRIVSGGTDTHLLLVDLTSRNITGRQAQDALEKAGITVNKNLIPFDKLAPAITSGIRLGTAAVTTRGMKEQEMDRIADLIDRAIKYRDDAKGLDGIKRDVLHLTRKFPLYPELKNDD